jgi:hypothetical protein
MSRHKKSGQYPKIHARDLRHENLGRLEAYLRHVLQTDDIDLYRTHLMYAIELASAGFLGGNVQLRPDGVYYAGKGIKWVKMG